MSTRTRTLSQIGGTSCLSSDLCSCGRAFLAVPMNDELRSQKAEIDEIRRRRADLVEQIHESQRTITRSLELIRRIDEMLAKSELRP